MILGSSTDIEGYTIFVPENEKEEKDLLFLKEHGLIPEMSVESMPVQMCKEEELENNYADEETGEKVIVVLSKQQFIYLVEWERRIEPGEPIYRTIKNMGWLRT